MPGEKPESVGLSFEIPLYLKSMMNLWVHNQL